MVLDIFHGVYYHETHGAGVSKAEGTPFLHDLILDIRSYKTRGKGEKTIYTIFFTFS